MNSSSTHLLISRCARVSFLALTALLTAACDFQGVAVGEWDVSYDSRDNNRGEIWLITAEDELVLDDGETSMTIPVELAGSRISWALDESAESVSFAGSVNGSRFAGTLYTQEGNRSVYGRRR